MADKTLDDLFYDTLRDMYYAERHILKTLPTLQKAAVSDQLKAAFEHHHTETEGQIARLEQVFALIDRKPTSKRCPAIDGILTEGDEALFERLRALRRIRHNGSRLRPVRFLVRSDAL